MRGYYFTTPESLDSIVRSGIELSEYRAYQPQVKLSPNKDFEAINAMMILLDTPHIAIVEVEIPDRVWMSTSRDPIIVYQRIDPEWIVNTAIV